MSASRPGPQPPGQPSGPRYQRSTGGLVAALLVTLLAVGAFVLVRGAARENAATPVPTLDYTRSVEQGRQDGRLAVLAPADLPPGWRATSASYQRGPSPAWHLGLLTDEEAYVGVEESRASQQELAREHVDEDASRDGSVRIAGRSWQVWRDAGGDYAVSRSLAGPDGERESVLVVGSAPEEQVRALAAQLTSG